MHSTIKIRGKIEEIEKTQENRDCVCVFVCVCVCVCVSAT